MMLFKPIHIILIMNGEKTVTRRNWKKKMAKKGNTYACQTDFYQKRENCPVIIKANKVYQEPLGEMTKEDLEKEGGYTRTEFKRLWKKMHGWWNPNRKVWVVEFEMASDGGNNIPGVDNIYRFQKYHREKGKKRSTKELLQEAIHIYRSACWDLDILTEEAKTKLEALEEGNDENEERNI